MFAVNRDIVTTTVKVYEPNHVSTLPHRPKVLYGRRRRMEWATVSNATERSNGLSKLETIVAELGDYRRQCGQTIREQAPQYHQRQAQ